MKENKKVPEIRFPEFTDDWEQRKLGELCSLITKGTTPKDKSGNGEVNFVKVENIDTDNGEITSMSKISIEEHEGYLRRSRLEENDILFSIAGTLGRVSVVKPSILPANTNQALAIIRTNKGYIPYLTTVLKGPAVEDFIRKNPTIGAQPNLSLEQVNNLDISYPEYDEQVKIGDYFESLDNLITLHQRKCDKIKELKSCMLQKMFPKKGEKAPEIRFPEFTDDWEQRKLESVAKYRNGKAHEGDIDEGGDYIVVNSKFVSTDGEVKKYSTTQIEPLYENELAFVLSDVPNGKAIARTFLVDKSGIYTLNQRIAGITPLDVTYPYFLHILMNRHPYFLKFDDGVKQTNLSLKDVLGFEAPYPSYEEQKKIGEYFRNLDNLITLHQRKCDTLKELKKGMLQKMFV